MKLAMYKGPPTDAVHIISHYATRLWTWSDYSHGELVVDGVCYSSSGRDGGVRHKVINLNSGRWDLFDITDDESIKRDALAWFDVHDGDKYDYRNIVRFVLPFVGHDENKWVCYEAIGAALGIDKPHLLDAERLLLQANKLPHVLRKGV